LEGANGLQRNVPEYAGLIVGFALCADNADVVAPALFDDLTWSEKIVS